ncbi:MAG: hypothetical protein HPY50_04665 [Firmicutes bacterium]|nr:hypothetical protein [Bacillota bacterium]
MSANRMYLWLEQYGAKYGWQEVAPEEAQASANMGQPTVTVWFNPSEDKGHIQVVRPMRDGEQYDPRRGALVAQAGVSNFNYGTAGQVLGNKIKDTKYYTHR